MKSFGPTTCQSKEDEAVNRVVTPIAWDGCKKNVKGLVTMVTRVPGIQRCNLQKTSPGYLQKGGLHCQQNATQMMHKYLRSKKCGLYKMTFA